MTIHPFGPFTDAVYHYGHLLPWLVPAAALATIVWSIVFQLRTKL